MPCNEALRVHAYFDGELDAAAAAGIERHLETCADCAALLKDIEETRSALRDDAPYYRASDDLREHIAGALDREDGKRRPRVPAWTRKPFLTGALSGAVATAFAAALAFVLLLQPAPALLVDDLTNAHLRSLISDHLV